MLRSLVYFTRLTAQQTAGSRRYSYKPTLLHSEEAMPLEIDQVIFPNIDAVLNVFNDGKYKENDSVKQLMNLFNETNNKVTYPRVHPFIVIEGLDLSGKSTMSRKLATKIQGVQLRTPPPSISTELRSSFNDHSDLKGAFYTLGNYMAATEIARTLQTQPVVLDRFWHSTAANALARTVQSHSGDFVLPKIGDKVYEWPADLIKPDIVFYLAVSENERLRRQERREQITKEELMLKDNHKFRQDVILAYQYMVNPAVKLINGDATVSDTLDTLYEHVKNLLQPLPEKA